MKIDKVQNAYRAGEKKFSDTRFLISGMLFYHRKINILQTKTASRLDDTRFVLF